MLPNDFTPTDERQTLNNEFSQGEQQTVFDVQTPAAEALALANTEVYMVDSPPERDSDLLPVVGIGGSAGSISALQQFFGGIPTDLGMAYVVIIHLLQDHNSSLTEILQARTQMPVIQVTSKLKMQPNHVYVIPPAYHLTMSDGYIQPADRREERGKRVAVDLFFRTLAASHRSKAVAVVLSGTDGDGAIGIKRIKEHGGVTVAQDPEEAQFDGMPRAAIETGMVDWILSIEQMTTKFVEFIQNERNIHLPPADPPEITSEKERIANRQEAQETALREVLAFVHARTGHDFVHYKRATVLRRIMRRLQVNSQDSIPSYAKFLRTHPGEAGALLQDLLISVTNFFRDPEAFLALGSLLPRIFRGKSSGDLVRVWVPGCATGEEAYSIAMMLIEHAEKLDFPPEIQIFATDLDETALRSAREGVYPATIVADVSPERLRRFFVLDQGRYRIKKEVRERILFAPHNLLKDSPFSRLDMISCRNLMIYFNRTAQNRVLELFHFALQGNGLLFMGSSESADDNPLFTAQDKKHRIYERQPMARPEFSPTILPLPSIPRIPEISPLAHIVPNLSLPTPPEPSTIHRPTLSFSELHLKLLEESSPPSILVNHNYEIMHLSEHAGQYLRFAGGEATMNLLNMVPAALRLELRAALFRAVQAGESVEVPPIAIEINGKVRNLGARVRPLRSENNGLPSAYVLVIFDEYNMVSEKELPPQTTEVDPIATRLEAELQHLKAYLRASIEQYEASSEELKASNEELQAMNEEQRSASEELETSREEIQAANEELITLNAELKSKVEEISRTNSDLQNLIASTDFATIFLSRDLRIKRYTPPAVELFNLIPTDTGRPLVDLRHRFNEENFTGIIEKVGRTLITEEHEVSTTDGRWFMLRVSPYRTTEDMIDGVVLTFIDITRRKTAEEEVRSSHDQLELRVQERTKELSDEIIKRQILEEERQQLTQRIVFVQEEERKRISRELHDNMGQHLTAIMMNIAALQTDENGGEIAEESESHTSTQLSRLRSMVEDLITITHDLARELRPAILDNVGLEAALRDYMTQWSAQTGIKAEFESNIPPNGDQLPGDVATALYRVVQEALTNVVRHSGASRASVVLDHGPQLTTAIIEDNGNGYDVDNTTPKRLGLMGMRERMTLVNGTLDIESSTETGTTVYARVPHTGTDFVGGIRRVERRKSS